jgi:hypothetical protein
MTTIRGLRYFEVDFNADGGLNTDTGAGSGGLPEAVAAGGISDVFVFSHGWNTGVSSARDLYDDMFGQLADQLGPHLGTSAAVGVIWPSLLFPDDAPASSPAALVPSTGSQLATALAPAFPDRQQALTTIGQLLDDQPQDPDRLNEFHTLATSLVTTPSNAVEDSGEEAFADDPTGAVLAYAHGLAPKAASGGQAGLNPFTALWTGAREVLRTLSYYERKNRAGWSAANSPVGAQFRRSARLLQPGWPQGRSDRRGQPRQIAHADSRRLLPLRLRIRFAFQSRS